MAAAAAPKRPHFVLDAEEFDCPFCMEPMMAHVYQCRKGHILCPGCLERFRKRDSRCPTCREWYEDNAIRNLYVEGQAARFLFSCKWKCGFDGKPQDLLAHVAKCKRREVTCIVDGCDHRCAVSDLPRHMVSHDAKQIYKVVMGRDGGNYRLDRLGQRFFEGGEGTEWMPALLTTPFGQVCITGQRIENDCVTLDIRHFLKPLKYTLVLKDEQNVRSLSFSGVSAAYDDVVEPKHIYLYKKQAEQFVLYRDNLCMLAFHLYIDEFRQVLTDDDE